MFSVRCPGLQFSQISSMVLSDMERRRGVAKVREGEREEKGSCQGEKGREGGGELRPKTRASMLDSACYSFCLPFIVEATIF